MNKTFLRRIGALAVAGLLLGNVDRSQATLLVYEGFNGYGSSLSSVAPNSNTVGLNQSTSYAGSGLSNYTVVASSLSFGSNFATSGGALSVSSGTAVMAGQIALASSPYTGTLYSSYLVNIASKGGLAADGAVLRISNDTTNGTERFLTFADSRSSSTNVSAGYDPTQVNATTGLATGTTYLMIGRFTRVGSGLTSGSPGVGTVFALTLAQYGSFLAGGATDSYLDTTAVGTASNQISARISDSVTSGTFSLATGNYTHFVSVGESLTFDELRFGSTLADVTPVPEPSAGILVLGGFAVLLVLRRFTLKA